MHVKNVRGEKDVGWFVERTKRTGRISFRFVLYYLNVFCLKKKTENKRANGIQQRYPSNFHSWYNLFQKKKGEEKRPEKIKKKKRKSVGYRASFSVIEASHLIIKVVVICIAIYLGDSSESFSSPYPGQRPAERTIIR